jgi:hypothetical protein
VLSIGTSSLYKMCLAGDLSLSITQVHSPEDSHCRSEGNPVLEWKIAKVEGLDDGPDLPIDEEDGYIGLPEPLHHWVRCTFWVKHAQGGEKEKQTTTGQIHSLSSNSTPSMRAIEERNKARPNGALFGWKWIVFYGQQRPYSSRPASTASRDTCKPEAYMTS